MSLTLTIDSVCKRYGLLPSEFLNRGNSLDLYIADIAQQFETYVHNKHMNKNMPSIPEPPELTEDEMLAMIKRVKEQQ
jgi:hypothetical protein